MNHPMQDKQLLLTRRAFVKFMSGAAVSAPLLNMNSCALPGQKKSIPHHIVKPINPSRVDDVLLSEGMNYKVIISWDDVINKKGDRFGFNNDYTACLELSDDEILMWVNHEYVDPLLIHQNDQYKAKGAKRSKAEIIKEMKAVGGSIIKIKRDKTGMWTLDKNSRYNRRVDGTTKIPLISERPISGSKTAIGTHGNCAGGVTPWNTILTCEEGYHIFFTEKDSKGNIIKKADFAWDQHFDYAPEHYGWVVEVNPYNGQAKKLTALGRYSHECATCVELEDGRTVVYSGDDKNDQHLYKFISSKPKSLESGELFVANLETGKWMSMDRSKQKVLQDNFKDQTEVNTFCREAAKLLGATPLDRPEDIQINPKTGDVFITLTNNMPKKNFHGSILRLKERKGYQGQDFTAKHLFVGGENMGFSCPDNIAFDRKGNLWVCSDISGTHTHKPVYDPFKNNGIYYIPMTGASAGEVYQVASAPVNAEFTGLSFSPDGKSLFVSVQHPGEKSTSMKELKSDWPNRKGDLPRSSVIQIHGTTIDKLLGGV